MTLDELKTRVKIKVDEYTPSGVSHSFDDYLEPMLNESADELSDKAPMYLLEPSIFEPTWLDAGSGVNFRWEDDLAIADTPSSFSRIYEVRFPKWKKSVHVAITPQHPQYALQQNEFTKAGYGRPVVYMKTGEVEDDSFAKVLYCGKVRGGAIPTTFLYIAYKTPAEMPDVLDEALTWLAASKLLQILEYPEQAKLAYGNHKAELQYKNK